MPVRLSLAPPSVTVPVTLIWSCVVPATGAPAPNSMVAVSVESRTRLPVIVRMPGEAPGATLPCRDTLSVPALMSTMSASLMGEPKMVTGSFTAMVLIVVVVVVARPKVMELKPSASLPSSASLRCRTPVPPSKPRSMLVAVLGWIFNAPLDCKRASTMKTLSDSSVSAPENVPPPTTAVPVPNPIAMPDDVAEDATPFSERDALPVEITSPPFAIDTP